jgi:hypothetical protein
MRDPEATRLYVEHHMWPDLSSANQANMSYLGSLDKVGRGRVHATYEQIAARRGRSRRTIQIQIQGLIATRRFLAREGWTFVILGAADHDLLRCGHGACIAYALDAEEARRKLAAADQLAVLRRKRAAEKKARQRAERRQAVAENPF